MRFARLRRDLLRFVAIVGSLAAVLAPLAWSGWVEPIWLATLAAVVFFYVLVHVVPDTIFRLQSMPYTYQLHNNWGRRGFELQNVTYAAYHTHWYNHATHAAFPVEAWLWFVAAAWAGGALACGALALALVAQAFSFGERRFAIGLAGWWVACAGSAALAVRALGDGAYATAQLGLVGLGFWRFTGHWVEPLPPGVQGNRGFVALREAPRDWRLARPMLLGYLSEFCAGLPFRLVNGWLFLAAQRLGFAPREALGWPDARAAAQRIHREGWGAQPTTAAIVSAARALERPAAPPMAREDEPPPHGDPEPLREFSIRLTACDTGASVWLLAIGGRTVLFDAWLDDPYVSGSPRFFSARRVEPPKLPASALPLLDAIVLSSAQQDHCHPRTLERLDKRTAVFAEEGAARVARELGFVRVTELKPGVPVAVAGDAITALALEGYGRNLAVVLRDERSGERVCIAHHGINAGWLAKNAASVFRWQFAPDPEGRLVDTLCLGVHTTLLRPPGVPAWLLADGGTIVPDPTDSAATVSLLAPRRVLFSHCTREVEQGFAVRHLLRYPSASDDLGHATRVLRERCAGVSIEGLPAPGIWV